MSLFPLPKNSRPIDWPDTPREKIKELTEDEMKNRNIVVGQLADITITVSEPDLKSKN